jgi:hypothetical protein
VPDKFTLNPCVSLINVLKGRHTTAQARAMVAVRKDRAEAWVSVRKLFVFQRRGSNDFPFVRAAEKPSKRSSH